MNLENVEFYFSGGKRGWVGDSPLVLLDTSLAKSYGWHAIYLWKILLKGQ